MAFPVVAVFRDGRFGKSKIWNAAVTAIDDWTRTVCRRVTQPESDYKIPAHYPKVNICMIVIFRFWETFVCVFLTCCRILQGCQSLKPKLKKTFTILIDEDSSAQKFQAWTLYKKCYFRRFLVENSEIMMLQFIWFQIGTDRPKYCYWAHSGNLSRL